MKLLHRPKDLWIISAEFCAVLPLFLLNFAIYYKLSLMKFLALEVLRPFAFSFGIFLLWFAVTLTLLLKGRWAGFFSFFVYSASCLYINVYLLMKFKNYGLAFYAMAFLVFCIYLLFNMRTLLRISYLNHGRRWYEGAPRFLPEIKVQIGEISDLHVSSLDLHGCFLFGAGCAAFLPPNAAQQEPLSLRFTVNNETLELPIAIVSMTTDSRDASGLANGMGVAFTLNSFDLQKHLRNFILRLRSHGYIEEFLL